MEDIIGELLVQQIKERRITVRALYHQMEVQYEKDPRLRWISMTTLERRLQNPNSITDEELVLMRESVKNLISGAEWIHIQRNITERMRYKYARSIDAAISNGFALSTQIRDYNNTGDDKEYVLNVLTFYKTAPDHIKKWWLTHLETYLNLPNLAKASIMCSAYIGRSLEKSCEYTDKVNKFLNYFPFFQGINILSAFNNNDLGLLGKVMSLASDVLEDKAIPSDYRRYALDKESIGGFGITQTRFDEFEEGFCRLAVSYKAAITDYDVSYKDFIHECCFVLFVEKVEWLLALATAIFIYRYNQECTYNLRREYHPRGCTGFKFTDKELDYLCELLYVIDH